MAINLSKVSSDEQVFLSSEKAEDEVILNSSSAKKGIGNQYKYWCFTLNNYTTEQIEQLEHIFGYECDWYIFQEEVGKEGTPHLQGTICLKVRQRLTQVKVFDPKIHWSNTKAVNASKLYCSKYETKNGAIYCKGIQIPEVIEVDEPYGWQLDVMNLIKNKPDKRKIHWFWESEGNVGKSTLCKYLALKHKAIIVSGKANDMFHMISKTAHRKIIIVDCPRSNKDYMNYGAIEQIKNGHLFSGKYDGEQVLFNVPHVIVFANDEPDYEKMSMDRWDVININVLNDT